MRPIGLLLNNLAMGRRSGAGSAPWYLAGGEIAAENCVAAYSAVGAASQEDSYINLANPGTNDLSVALGSPGWSAATGWSFDGASALTMGAITLNSEFSIFISVADVSDISTGKYFGDASQVGGRRIKFSKYSTTASDLRMGVEIGTATAVFPDAFVVAGNHVITNTNLYTDGVVKTPSFAANWFSYFDFWIGAAKGDSARMIGKIKRFAIYNVQLTPQQIVALSNPDIEDLYFAPVSPNPATVVTAASALTIPTYDGSGEAVHPSVYDAGSGSTWNGKRYWMAMTPYPGGNDNYENPSILCSDDGLTWEVPVGLTNPLAPDPGGTSHHSDTELLMDGNTLYCVYRFNTTGVEERLYETHSTDGVTWSEAVQILQSDTQHSLLSPSIIKDGSVYKMWVMDAITAPYTIKLYTAPSIAGPWSGPISCSVYRDGTPYTPARQLWHLDVVKVNDNYYAIICDYNQTNSSAYFATSGNGIQWQLDRDVTHVGGLWDKAIYRGTLVWNGTDFDYWYSANNGQSPVVWGIGKTKVTGITVP